MYSCVSHININLNYFEEWPKDIIRRHITTRQTCTFRYLERIYGECAFINIQTPPNYEMVKSNKTNTKRM